MSARKPTLTALVVRRHFGAALLTLGVLLLAILALTDVVTLRNRRHALAQQLSAISSANDTMLLLSDLSGRQDELHTGSLILDAQGHWTDEPTPEVPIGPDNPRHPDLHRWEYAPAVLKAGILRGESPLPWEPKPVIWAARKLDNPDGEPEIVVAWERVDAIRAAATPIYFAVALVTLLAFGISVAVALNTIKDVRGVLDVIADSSAQMAAGDFSVRLPQQPAQELDRVCAAIHLLAQELDRTTGDLHAEHEHLQRLEGLQRQFVADASHELRSPLTAMRVTLEAWQDGVLRPDEQPAALGRLLSETERLGNLVGSLLNLSRIEFGRETVAPAPLRIAGVIEAVTAGFHQPQRARVLVALPDGVPPVMADRDALHRVLHNLLENAQRFTDPRGTIRVWAQPDGAMVRIGVTDTGCGIAPDFLPRIWDRFARASDARAEGRAGSGLGLAIVKALTEAMGGEVGVTSTLGAGTEIWLRLPAATPQDIAERMDMGDESDDTGARNPA